MIDAIFQDSLVVKIIINTLLISIPEQLYAVMFTLILVGEFEYWKEPECKRLINRFDYVRVFLPTVIGALISNIMIYTGLNHGFFQFISPLVTFIIIVFTNDIFRDASAIKWIVKAFIFFLIAFLSIGIMELLYLPLILYGTDKSIAQIRGNIIILFLVSLPSRFMQYSLLLYLISRKRTLLKGRLIKNLLTTPLLTTIFSLLVLSNITFLWYLYKSIVFDKVLISNSNIGQMVIISSVVIFPILNIMGFLWGVYLIKNKEARDKKNASEKLYKLLNDMKSYTNNEKHDNIKWKLNEIGLGIEEVAETLYRKSGTDTR